MALYRLDDCNGARNLHGSFTFEAPQIKSNEKSNLSACAGSTGSKLHNQQTYRRLPHEQRNGRISLTSDP